MDSLVLELQMKAANSDCSLTDLLRLAVMVASKLNVFEFRKWCNNELTGYTDAAPSYRELRAEIKGRDPVHGNWVPWIFPDAESSAMVREVVCKNPVSELQHMLEEKGQLYHPFQDQQIAHLMATFETDIVPVRLLTRSQVAGILDAVRSKILDWALRLEAEGILGEGLTFTRKEREAATAIQIGGDFHGVIGNVDSSQLQVGDFNSIEEGLTASGIGKVDREELRTLLAAYKAASGSEKRTIAQRGVEWVTKHASALGSLGTKIFSWFVVGGTA